MFGRLVDKEVLTIMEAGARVVKKRTHTLSCTARVHRMLRCFKQTPPACLPGTRSFRVAIGAHKTGKRIKGLYESSLADLGV